MNQTLKLITILFLLSVVVTSFASEEHHEHDFDNGKIIGNDKAIVAIDAEKGFKLSNEAIKTLRIKTAKFSGGQIPQSAFVTDRDRKGFYLFRESYFKYFDESHLKNLNSDDHVAVSGVDVLRITEVYINDNSEYGHGH